MNWMQTNNHRRKNPAMTDQSVNYQITEALGDLRDLHSQVRLKFIMQAVKSLPSVYSAQFFDQLDTVSESFRTSGIINPISDISLTRIPRTVFFIIST